MMAHDHYRGPQTIALEKQFLDDLPFTPLGIAIGREQMLRNYRRALDEETKQWTADEIAELKAYCDECLASLLRRVG